MRALFYIGDAEWSSSARVFLAAARGLAGRGHPVIVVCGSGTPVVEHIAGNGIETVLMDPGANVASATWEMRRVLQDRFVEVAFVHTDREQMVVSSAMRVAERGAVIRRIPPFTHVDDRAPAFALKIAAAGLLFTSDAERQAATMRGWKIPAAVAPLGVDAAAYDEGQATMRASLGVPSHATLFVCPYDESGRMRLATVMRTLAVLAPRHPDLHAVVFGPGSLDDTLRMHASALNVGGLVTFIGEPDDPIATMRAGDIAWVTAEADTGAFGFLDAMALRLPVVAERSPLACQFVADGSTGALVTPGDSSGVAAMVASMLAHPDRRAAMGSAGRVRVQRELTETAMIDGFERAATGAGDRTKWSVR